MTPLAAVCVLTSSYPRSPGDYAGVFVADLVREWVKQGVEVIVLAPGAPGLDAFEVADGARVYRFSYFWPRRWQRLAYGEGIPSNIKRNPLLCLLFPFFFAAQVRALRRLVRREKIQLVNAHWMLVQGLAAAWIRKRGVRTVLTFHSEELRALARFPFSRALTDWVVRRMDHIFSVSSAHGRFLQDFLGREVPVEVLPMGVDVQRFESSRWPREEAHRRCGLFEEQGILFLGRLDDRKGARVLIHALGKIPSSRLQRTVLFIAGDGNERFQLEREVRKLDLTDRVRFLGRVPREEVPWLLAGTDIVCVPSIVEKSGLTEGLPMIILEAMAMSKVVVASSVGGIPDVIHDGVNGFLVEPGNPQDLAQKLCLALSLGERAETVARAGRSTAEKFSVDSVAGRYAAVFRSLQGVS